MKTFLYAIIITSNILQKASASYCTLCEGTTTIFHPNAIALNEKSCIDVSMTVVFIDETQSLCSYVREVVKDTCCVATSKTNTNTYLPM